MEHRCDALLQSQRKAVSRVLWFLTHQVLATREPVREAKWLVQGHTAGKWKSWDVPPESNSRARLLPICFHHSVCDTEGLTIPTHKP